MSVRLATAQRGMDFTRSAIALALAKGHMDSARNIAHNRWGLSLTKAATPASLVSDLDGAQDEQSVEFFNMVRERSIVGRLQGIRQVPFNVALVSVDAGTTAAFIGEGHAIPVSGFEYTAGGLPILSIGGLNVFSEEFLRAVGSETATRADLMRAYVASLDASFIDPANAGVADIMPASVTNGVTPITATADPKADIKNLVDAFDGDLDAAYIITTPTLAVALHGAGFEGAGARGGEVAGIPMITSRHVPDGVIALLDPTSIAYANDPGVIQASGDAALQMDTAPTMDAVTPTATQLVSLFQVNCIALKITGHENWAVRRAGAVSLIAGASY